MATTSKTAASAAGAAPAATQPPTVNPSRAYMEVVSVDEETGEVTEKPRFKYLPGHPRQIRFDGKAGMFNLNGEDPIANKLTFIPVSLRVFVDSLFSGGAFHQGRKTWAELFYFDDKGVMCGVLFHGYSVENLLKLNASLFYDDLKLTEVMLTVKATKKENKKVGGTYFIADFSYAPADPAEVQARQQFAEDFDIYRAETVTGEADTKISEGYRVPQAEQHAAQLPAAQTTEEETTAEETTAEAA